MITLNQFEVCNKTLKSGTRILLHENNEIFDV